MRLLYNKHASYIDIAVILILLNCLGFPGNYSSLTGGLVETVVEYFCFLLVLLLMLSTSGFPNVQISSYAMPVYIFLAVICIESIFVTNYLGLELISCLRFIVMAFFGLWLAENYETTNILELFCVAQLLFLIFTIIFVLICPEEGFQDTTIVVGALRGLYTTKNACGSELAFGIVATALYLKINMLKGDNNGFFLYILLFVQISMLLLSQSVGPLFCALIACFYIYVFNGVRFNPGMMFIVVSIAFLYIALNLMPYFETVLSIFGKDSSLTGRTDLWNQIIEVMSKNKTLTGFGYAMFWRDQSAYTLIQAGFSEYSFLGNITSGSHNMILDWWLNTGLVGIASLFLMLLTTVNKVKESKISSRLFVSAIMIAFTIHGLSERGMDASSYSTLFLFVSIGVSITEKAQNLSEESNNEEEISIKQIF